MSKELEAIKYLLEQCVNENIKKDLLDIETALKRYSTIEQVLIKRGFDNLEDFLKQLDEYVQISEKEHEKLMMLESQSYQNKLKALEIIKELILEDLAFDDKEQAINFSFGISTLCIKIEDKTKYDLLKEVLL